MKSKLSALYIGALSALVLSIGVASPSFAITMYTYTGNNFTTIHNSTPPAGTYTTNMSISGGFSLASPLAGGLEDINITLAVQTFSFYDGRNTIDQFNASLSQFIVSSDALGNLSRWNIFVWSGQLVSLDINLYLYQPKASHPSPQSIVLV
jgi:hypothetical protein